MKPERLAESLIAEASASVIAEFFIEHENDRHIIYVHDIMVKPNGEIDIKYSTPSEDVDKDWLYNEVQKVVRILLNDVIEAEKKQSFYQKFIGLFKR